MAFGLGKQAKPRPKMGEAAGMTAQYLTMGALAGMTVNPWQWKP